jgi:Type II secretion system protein C
MDSRRSARYPTVPNVILVAATAYFAALCVNHMVSASLHPAVAPPSIATSPGTVESTHLRAAYDQIAQHDIFNLAPPPHASVVAAPTAPDLHIKLLGTSILNVGEPFAIIEDRRTGQQLLFRVGQTIPDTGRLVEVKRSSVIIDPGGGQLVTVAMGSPDLTPGTSEPNPLPMRGSRSREDRGFIQR